MANDFTVMKTVMFGGFKKSDVLEFIEKLQEETEDVKKTLDLKRAEAIELKNKIDDLEEKIEELSKVHDKITEKDAEIKELSEKLDNALNENKQLSEKSFEFNEKSEKLRRAEKQIGAAYIDARRYSDDLVEGAKAKAKDIGASASQDIKREANEIEQLLKDVDGIKVQENPSSDYDSNYWLNTITIESWVKVRGEENAYTATLNGAVGGAGSVTHATTTLTTDKRW